MLTVSGVPSGTETSRIRARHARPGCDRAGAAGSGGDPVDHHHRDSPDATLSNTNGDTLTHPGGSITFTQAMLTAGVLTGLAITPTSADDPNFTLHVTATAK